MLTSGSKVISDSWNPPTLRLVRTCPWKLLSIRFRLTNLPYNSAPIYQWPVDFSESMNGFIERFNHNYHEAVLDIYVLQARNEVREQTERWATLYRNLYATV